MRRQSGSSPAYATGVSNRRWAKIVAISFAVLHRVRWGEAVALGILQQADQQTGGVHLETIAASLVIAFQFALNLFPQLLRNNGLVFAGIRLISMWNLTQVNAIVQNLVECATGIKSSSPPASGTADPQLALVALLIQVGLQF